VNAHGNPSRYPLKAVPQPMRRTNRLGLHRWLKRERFTSARDPADNPQRSVFKVRLPREANGSRSRLAG
jgi:hypothetical protein